MKEQGRECVTKLTAITTKIRRTFRSSRTQESSYDSRKMLAHRHDVIYAQPVYEISSTISSPIHPVVS